MTEADLISDAVHREEERIELCNDLAGQKRDR